MNRLLKVLLKGAGLWLLNQYRQTSLDLVRIQAAIWYLRGVKTVRAVFVSLAALIGALLLAILGFVLIHVGLLGLLPAPYRFVALLVLGLIYLLIGLCVIRRLCSQKHWMRTFQAHRCVSFATGKTED